MDRAPHPAAAVSWRDAPLAIRSEDLAAWVVARCVGSTGLGQRTSEAAQDLAISLALALTFPERRSAHLVAADEAVVRLRTLLSLAERSGLLRAQQRRYATSELAEIGRMIGGWRKRWIRKGRRLDDPLCPEVEA